jgi:cytoskeletal protein CcmA (bactofilin family)
MMREVPNVIGRMRSATIQRAANIIRNGTDREAELEFARLQRVYGDEAGILWAQACFLVDEQGSASVGITVTLMILGCVLYPALRVIEQLGEVLS